MSDNNEVSARRELTVFVKLHEKLMKILTDTICPSRVEAVFCSTTLLRLSAYLNNGYIK